MNIKEKDAETGFNYFGARYYDSDLSMWRSVDPLADKYPGISPYVYCANNPIKLVDPDGREEDWCQDKKGEVKWTLDGEGANPAEVIIDGRQWGNVEKQSKGVSVIKLIIRR